MTSGCHSERGGRWSGLPDQHGWRCRGELRPERRPHGSARAGALTAGAHRSGDSRGGGGGGGGGRAGRGRSEGRGRRPGHREERGLGRSTGTAQHRPRSRSWKEMDAVPRRGKDHGAWGRGRPAAPSPSGRRPCYRCKIPLGHWTRGDGKAGGRWPPEGSSPRSGSRAQTQTWGINDGSGQGSSTPSPPPLAQGLSWAVSRVPCGPGVHRPAPRRAPCPHGPQALGSAECRREAGWGGGGGLGWAGRSRWSGC